MKQASILLAIIIMTVGSAYGDAYFSDRALTQLRVTQVNPQDNTARVTDTDGNDALVTIGDTIGQPAVAVINISKHYVTVKTDQGTTKIPVIGGVNLDDNRIGLH